MKYKVSLNGKTYEVEVDKGEARVISVADTVVATPQQAPTASVTAPVPQSAVAGEAVESPMPGTVLDIKVAAGQKVKSGELLLLLEAMKMENEIVAPHDAVIKQVVATKGASVSTGDTLIVLG